MITIINYGAGNTGSVLNMISKVGGRAKISSDPSELRDARKILLPGVGSFDNAMQKLNNLGLTQPILDCAKAGVPILGICLGMQILSYGSEEGLLPGLGIIPGRVRRFDFNHMDSLLKVPHMGWNQAKSCKDNPLVNGLDIDARFYFVHSYYFECEDPSNQIFKTQYGHEFTSGVQLDNVMGVQFHPEKSHRHGMQLIKNFIML